MFVFGSICSTKINNFVSEVVVFCREKGRSLLSDFLCFDFLYRKIKIYKNKGLKFLSIRLVSTFVFCYFRVFYKMVYI